MSTFTSNGLLSVQKTQSLDSISSLEEETRASNSVQSSAFQPNGLLGDSALLPASLSKNPRGATIDQPTLGPFLHNGLLGPASTSTSEGPLSPRPEFNSCPDDDDLLPTTSEAFGHLAQAHNAVIPSIHREPITIPRTTVQARTHDGKPVFLHRKARTLDITTSRTTETPSMTKLLDVPIHKLMQQLTMDTVRDLDQPESPGNDLPQGAVEDTLWVDRYRPQKFTDLTGNERVARETISWIKSWDYCVFGKRAVKSHKEKEERNDTLDEFRRPKEKVLLLSGPPGLGKTTMIHVLAKHAGYDVMEINASDARSGQVIDERIRPTLESGSALGSSKPVLLVIDEIDGATGAGDNNSTFIHRLVQLVSDKSFKRKKAGKQDPNRPRPILRPIICICNDINASSLTKLRPIAMQIRFQRPADIHTVKRLREVCEMEALRAEGRALSTLVALTNGDMRSCLNTLQFIKVKHCEVTEAIVRRATTNLKEPESSVASVLNSLFTPLSKKRIKDMGLSEDDENHYANRLCREIESSGKESAIATACFSHYTNLRHHDANLEAHEKAGEWLATFDHFDTMIYREGDFALASYQPYMLVPFYPLFQDRGAGRFERNHDDWEAMQRTKGNEEIFRSLSKCLHTATVRSRRGDWRFFAHAPLLQTEFASYINRIISPPLRPANSQIIKPKEKAMLHRLVELMASLELRFVQEKSEEGQLSYRLDPPVDVFVTYDNKRAADIAVSRYAVRHLVASEVEARLIANQAEAIEKAATKGNNTFGRKRGAGDENESEDRASKRPKMNGIDIADKPPVDFFGRPISTSKKPESRVGRGEVGDTKPRVVYKYIEGNSAAVRKPVKMSSLL